MLYLIDRSDNGIGNYRYLLLTFSAQDLLYTIDHHILYPVAESYKDSFLLGATRSFDSHLAIAVFFGIFGTSSALITGSFCYRMLLIKGMSARLIFGRVHAAIMAYTALSFIAWFAVARYVCVLDEETWDVMGAFLNGSIQLDLIHTAEDAGKYVIALYWLRELVSFQTAGDRARWAVIGSISALDTLFLLDYCAMAYCTVSIKRLLRKHTSMSDATIQLQRQLLRCLIGEMLFPLFTIYAAAFISMVPPIFGSFYYPLVAVIMPNLCGIHPLSDGLVLMATVAHYRLSFAHLHERFSFLLSATRTCLRSRPLKITANISNHCVLRNENVNEMSLSIEYKLDCSISG
ncbi:hypothetical protein PRIPAC_78791 [Pristionchus pacificus]|uniref:G protein-coupled receptor n=1 Tax=Pristionchus pacificus TaxID=54126 RepID=A0A2A6CK43_PRIPA|nr:hypothetical protein PRIPAC_78791 [Pristionchus pacificus]|eukprot:PDM78391.1 G protein-coupled receptor [Pristionchus pacificus]